MLHLSVDVMVHDRFMRKALFFVIWFLFLLLSVSLFCSKGLFADIVLGNIKENDRQVLQPTLVVGDIQSLGHLLDLSYLDEKPILFFLEPNYSRETLVLLERSNSIFFYQKGYTGLLLDLFPEIAETAIMHGDQVYSLKNPRYRVIVDDGSVKVSCKEEGYYQVFVKKKKGVKDKGGYKVVMEQNKIGNILDLVICDGKCLKLSSDYSTFWEDLKYWQPYGETYLTKGKHHFTIDGVISELLIVPKERCENIKNILKKKQASYFLTNENGIGRTIQRESKNTKPRNFIVANSGKYQVRVRLSPINKKIIFRNIDQKLSAADLPLMESKYGDNSIVSLSLTKYQLDLIKYPNLQISFDNYKPCEGLLTFVLELDTDKDNQADTLLVYQYKVGKEKALPKKEARLNKSDTVIEFSKVILKEKDFWYKANRELGRSETTDMYQWYYDDLGSKFAHYREGDYFVAKSDCSKADYFVITKRFPSIDLKENPYIELDYKLENPDVQTLWINFKIDTTGDGRPDTILDTGPNITPLTKLNEFTYLKETSAGDSVHQKIYALNRNRIDLLKDKPACNLLEVIIFCVGEGGFYLNEFSIGEYITGKEVLSRIREQKEGNTLLASVREKKSGGKIAEKTIGKDKARAKVTEEMSPGINVKKNKAGMFYLKLEEKLFNWKDSDVAWLDVKEKTEDGDSVFIVNDIHQQIHRKLKNIEACTLKGITSFYQSSEESASPLGLLSLKEIVVYGDEAKEFPAYISGRKSEQEWRKQFEEDSMQYGFKTVLDKKYLEEDTQRLERYIKDKLLCKENTEAFQPDNTDWKLDVIEPVVNYNDIYSEIVDEPIFKYGGEQYNLRNSFKTLGNESRDMTKTNASYSILDTNLQLKDLDITGEGKISIYHQSEYFKVDMIELTKPGEESLYDSDENEPEITFNKINPTRYIVDVNAEESFWLVFSESFSTGWKAYVRRSDEGLRQGTGERKNVVEPWSALVSARRDKGNRLELKEHQRVNGYANGWYVPLGQEPEVRSSNSEERQETIGPGEFQIVLEYQPQRLLEIGVLISGVTILSCIGYLCWSSVRRLVGEGKKTILSADCAD
jgi:hypothetical protein